MATSRPWTVYRPQPLMPRDEGLWTIDDDVPGLPGTGRRMSIVRRSDGGLVFYNAIPIPDSTLAQVHELGRPAQLLIPNQYHALDAVSFAQRLGVTVYAPDPARARLAPHLKCQSISLFPPDPSLRLMTVEGFSTREVIVLVGKTLLVADLLTNQAHQGGFNGWLMRLLGFTGPSPQLPILVRKRIGKDLAAVGALMQTLAAEPTLARIIPSHGAIIEQGAAQALREVAQTLVR